MVHRPLPATLLTRDEGAANHSRLCATHSDPGIHLFVYNQQMLPFSNTCPTPQRFPARHTREASEAIARAHRLDDQHVLFAQQNPSVVDQGVFHNDVIAVANESVLFIHEDALLDQARVLASLRSKLQTIQVITVPRAAISIADAVNSYLFNSQLVSLPDNTMALIAPKECETHPAIKRWIDEHLINETTCIRQVQYLDLKQSMQNGGGPACLRLRVALNEQEIAAMHQGVIVDAPLLHTLEAWVMRHYRDTLDFDALLDPHLIEESHTALDALTQILHLGAIYPFQTEVNVSV